MGTIWKQIGESQGSSKLVNLEKILVEDVGDAHSLRAPMLFCRGGEGSVYESYCSSIMEHGLEMKSPGTTGVIP